jgi:hypothetical protein
MTVQSRRSGASGSAELYLRDAVNLRNATRFTVRVNAVTATGRSLVLAVWIRDVYGHGTFLGHVAATRTARTVTFTVPTAGRGFTNLVEVAVSNSALAPVSSVGSRRATVGLYLVSTG